MAGSCPPTAPTGPPQGAPQSPMLPAHRTRRRPPGSTAPLATGGAKAGPPQATQAKDDTDLPAPDIDATVTATADQEAEQEGCETQADAGEETAERVTRIWR